MDIVSNRQRPRRGAYLADIVALQQNGRLPLISSTVGILDVWHEADCPRPQGGECRCHAEFGDITYPRIDNSGVDDGPAAA